MRLNTTLLTFCKACTSRNDPINAAHFSAVKRNQYSSKAAKKCQMHTEIRVKRRDYNETLLVAKFKIEFNIDLNSVDLKSIKPQDDPEAYLLLKAREEKVKRNRIKKLIIKQILFKMI